MFKQKENHKWRCYTCSTEFVGGEVFLDGLRGVCQICHTKKYGDNVNHPTHYTSGGIETIDYLEAKLSQDEFVGYLKGNILKYMSRANLKNGAEDYKKAQWYLNKLIEVMENE
jgi:hypothetical protein